LLTLIFFKVENILSSLYLTIEKTCKSKSKTYPCKFFAYSPLDKIYYIVLLIYRDQKDTAVSLWHFMKRRHPDLTFSEVHEAFCNGICMGGPAWDNILEFWYASNAEPTRVLFLTYEKVLQDPCDAVKKLAQFLGQPFSGAEEEAGVVTEIADLCSIDNLRNQKANKYGSIGGKFSHESFFRKRMAGDWTNHMTLEMAERLDSILREKLDGSGLIV
jgi:hypothetical protein